MIADRYEIPGPWPGRLFIGPRPRGSDWLADAARDWRRADIDTVVSLLTPGEIADLDLSDEPAAVRGEGMDFVTFPIEDRSIPMRSREFAATVTDLESELAAGRTVLVHCRQGVGRAGLVAAALLIAAGSDPIDALQQISNARGCPVPETAGQRQWILEFAARYRPAVSGTGSG